MRVKAAEGQSKVIRLSISNPFSSLRHCVPFKQANDKAVIQDNSVCIEQRKNYIVQISHCSLSSRQSNKKVWDSEHLFPSFLPSSAMKWVCLHTLCDNSSSSSSSHLAKNAVSHPGLSQLQHNVNITTLQVLQQYTLQQTLM